MTKKTLKVLEFDKIINKLVSFATSELGKEKAEKLLPYKDIDTIKAMLKETDDGVCYILKRGTPPLGGIRDIRQSLRRIEMGAVLIPEELLKIKDALRLCRQLKNHAFSETRSNPDDEKNIAMELISALETNRRIEDNIDRAILNEEEISDDASPTLRNIRRQIKDRQESIKDKLNSIIKSQKHQKHIQESLITVRGGRYVVPVKQEYKGEVPGLVHDSSASGATVFIEPMAVVEANNYIKQLMIKEQVEIERILAELTSQVSDIVPQLRSNIDILARLDFIFAKAKLSFHYSCVLPELREGGPINIKKGRHPLLTPEKVVPIDFWAGEEFSTLVITGPNTGGKTVTLKTVGLLTLMAQAGLHIPAADNTKIGVFSNIFADIGDEQSIEQSLSTFSSHMNNIVEILRKVDNKSLVLLDELGAGTDPTEGAALAMSILDYLYRNGAITAATTHYSELKIYAMISSHAENASCEFDVETLQPTFRLLIGVPGKSNAFSISKRLGLSDEILKRAKEFLTQEDIKFEDVLLSIEKDRAETEQEKMKAESYKLEIEKLRNELIREKEKINESRDKIIKEAREEARVILKDAEKESENIIEKLKRLNEEKEAIERNKTIKSIKASIKNKISKIDESLVEPLIPKTRYQTPPRDLKVGDSVIILNLNQKGTIIELPDASGEAIIQVGIMKINVHKTNLKLMEREQVKELINTKSGEIGKGKTMSISMELDLRGLTIDDALIKVDKYLDDASMAGLGAVILIHGKGTGALRTGIHRHLKGHPHIKSFRLGGFGEGGTGVTVVSLSS